MGTIGFCPLAKRDGEWRNTGLIAGEGDRPPCTGAKRRKGGETAAITK